MKKILLSILILFMSISYIHAQEGNTSEESMFGTIINVLEEKDIEINESVQKYQKLEILIEKGSKKGESITIENGNIPMSNVNEYEEGDKVVIESSTDEEGSTSYMISDYYRGYGLLILAIIFVFLSILMGKWKGLFSLVGMSVSFLVIIYFMLPQMEKGFDPIAITLFSCFLIIPVTFYLSHGFNSKSSVSILGTSVALLITILLSELFISLTHLTGTASEEAMFLQGLNGVEYNLRDLLFAGILIGTLGVLDDITVSQSAVVYQLVDMDRGISFRELYRRAMSIGRDHIASMINTLVLAYTGASIPLLLLFMNSSRSFDELISYEIVATEIVRTLVGSIGLILAVPITTVFAALWVKRGKYLK